MDQESEKDTSKSTLVVNCDSMMSTSYNSVGETVSEFQGQESEADKEEKHRLISQILELQHTLEDLSTRVESVRKENCKLRDENQILGQYIQNLMSSSSIFQSTSPVLPSKSRSGTSSAYNISPKRSPV